MAERFTEIGTHLARLARVRVDRARLKARETIALIVAGSFVFLVTSVLCAYGAVFFARGLSHTLSELAGQRPWLGELGAGLALLLGTAALGWLVWVVIERREFKKKLQEYRHADQA